MPGIALINRVSFAHSEINRFFVCTPLVTKLLTTDVLRKEEIRNVHTCANDKQSNEL